MATDRAGLTQRIVKPYAYHWALGCYVVVSLEVDARAHAAGVQLAIGLVTVSVLGFALRYSPPRERRQVVVMVAIATCVEVFSSLVWGVYRYTLGNLPLYVPPGHGLIYLFALRWARTPLARVAGDQLRVAVLVLATMWALAGVTVFPALGGRLDIAGVLLLPVFAWFLRGPTAAVFVGAFLATSLLEILGTSLGDWQWAATMPIVHIPTGNPPCVIAGAYCLMDYSASRVTPAFERIGGVLRQNLRTPRAAET